ncbi:MAG: hypothetical protein NT119_07780 [Actinobacteria bacterium]|nr:hypothetical protein [Actinomycetota bacterium]
MFYKFFNPRKYSWWAIAILFAVLTASCSQNAETDAVCESADRWNAASTGFADISAEFATTSPSRIREVFGELVSTLNTMSEMAPPQIIVSIEKLADTYGSFSLALEAIDWQGGMIAKDAAATSAAVRLASDEIEVAQTNLGDFIDTECRVEIKNVINKLPSVGTTLPDPVVQDETKEPPDVGSDNEQSVVASFGFLVVERFNVAITNEQALCIGSALISKDVTNNSQLDANYWNMLQLTFDECLVSINVAEFLKK